MKTPTRPSLKKGDRVNYHSRIGGPVTSTGHVLRDDPFQIPGQRHWLAFITGKAGYVTVDALSREEESE